MTAKVTYKGDLRTEIEHLASKTMGITDAPTDNRGMGQAFSPTDLVATATASCMITIMGIRAIDSEWNIVGMRADVKKIMRSDPRRIDRLEIDMYPPKDQTYDDHQKKILEKAALTCPVSLSLHPDIEQHITFHW